VHPCGKNLLKIRRRLDSSVNIIKYPRLVKNSKYVKCVVFSSAGNSK
jgi:hypothetical protein